MVVRQWRIEGQDIKYQISNFKFQNSNIKFQNSVSSFRGEKWEFEITLHPLNISRWAVARNSLPIGSAADSAVDLPSA